MEIYKTTNYRGRDVDHYGDGDNYELYGTSTPSPDLLERQRIKDLSFNLGHRDITTLESLDDQAAVAMYRSDLFMDRERKRIEQMTVWELFVESAHRVLTKLQWRNR